MGRMWDVVFKYYIRPTLTLDASSNLARLSSHPYPYIVLSNNNVGVVVNIFGLCERHS